MNATREKTRLWLLILVGVVATLLGQTHAREIFAPSPHVSGIFAEQTQASTGENYDGIQYDALDSFLAANGTGQLVQTEFAFARGASIQTPGVTQAGEAFVRVGATEVSTGVRTGSYAMPEATFNALGRDPAVLKNALDLPGSAPQYFRYIRPPAGSELHRPTISLGRAKL